jgi:hypothetical protein
VQGRSPGSTSRSSVSLHSDRLRKGEKRATMKASDVPRAVAAGVSTATALDLRVDDAVVLHDSNKLTLRLLPCDVLARVAPEAHQVAQFEIELAQRLAGSGSPVAALEPRVEPRVYERDGFVVTLWTYYEPATPREVSPADYASALGRLHAGMRKLDVPAPHFTDRVEQAQQLVASRDHTPALAGAERGDRQSENAYRSVDEHPRGSQGGPRAGFLIASRSGSRDPGILSSNGRHRRLPPHWLPGSYPHGQAQVSRRSADTDGELAGRPDPAA